MPDVFLIALTYAPALFAAYLAAFLTASRRAPSGGQDELTTMAVLAIGAVALLALWWLGAGIAWAGTFRSVFAKYAAVPLFFAVSGVIWAIALLSVSGGVATGTDKERSGAYGAALAILAGGVAAYFLCAALVVG